jgi:phospholipase C
MSKLFGSVNHIVVLVLENRSFDHMLGYLYYPANLTPKGAPYDGLTGTESSPLDDATPVNVFPIGPTAPNAYLMPGADPGEGYLAANAQLYGPAGAPTRGAVPPMTGFVTDYGYTFEWQANTTDWPIVSGTSAADIMGCFTPEALTVLSALARGYAVCDRWFASVPTETLPNRAFLGAATSQGHMTDSTHTITAPSIFGELSKRRVPWKIYGYAGPSLTLQTFTDIAGAPANCSGSFEDSRADAAAGTLPGYAFLEPSWGETGNSQHPNYDLAAGEQLILDVYRALRTGPAWASTLLIVTYDEHGGCYDHVPAPWGAPRPTARAVSSGSGSTGSGPACRRCWSHHTSRRAPSSGFHQAQLRSTTPRSSKRSSSDGCSPR